MADIYHIVGSPLKLNSTGDIALVRGSGEGQQRIMRRVLTNPNDLMMALAYGAGIPKQIGSTGDPSSIKALITEQMEMEEIVVQYPPPTVQLYSDVGTGFYQTSIIYEDNTSQETSQLKIPLGKIGDR